MYIVYLHNKQIKSFGIQLKNIRTRSDPNLKIEIR